MNEKGIYPAKASILGLEPGEHRGLIKWLSDLQQVFPRTRTYTETLNPTSVSANTTAEQTFTVAGLATTDIIKVSKPSHTTGLGIVNARCSAADTLAITFMNCTGSPIDPGSEDYLIEATRR